MKKRRKILFVFDWLVVGGEETEARLLAKNLPRDRYDFEVLACFRNERMTSLTHTLLERMGVHVDTTCYRFDDEQRRVYLAEKLRHDQTDVITACQGVRHPYRALQLLAPHERPALIEHGGVVYEAFHNPKDLTTRYIGVCKDIRDAAASVMEQPDHAVEIPSMIDLDEFAGHDRDAVRASLGVTPDQVVIGWVGRLDRKKRVEDFIEAAALVHRQAPQAQFLITGGIDAFMPEYRDELEARAHTLGLDSVLRFLGDRSDVPRLLCGMDALAWLSRGEGMPHVISEAGAAGVPVIATRDGGSVQQIIDGVSGIFVPHEDPAAVSQALLRLIADPNLRHSLGSALRQHVINTYSSAAVVPQWDALFDEVMQERGRTMAQTQMETH